jgi:redox-sensitive bicupin YhaK (pirin superfamily)
MGDFEAGKTANYSIKKSGNGVYAFILSGAVTINGEALSNRDGMGIENVEELTFLANTNAEILLMEVPMNV